ncbi:hypothetical protein BN59_01125 [Legionella massiliensis]|uniref:Uncharacterized protein n=1 Tax=Legionella massiliensis TaxID=1034943 RepID=A0A078KYJ6_9GAMM|nr:hypothetical protein [Legionella massiliensis]CDZ76849.1 hypothetical protein BN59_01125 [Legionella massiliensis]CEE12587.1 hypothetical protein BN1094_01125 [Legionella massiliensis]
MGLTVYTWKSGSKGWRGFKTPIKSTLLGGNVGHAAIELTWPANEDGDALAAKYQDTKGLSISKRTELVTKKVDGRYMAEERVVYFAYFSWWPGAVNGHHINNFQEDSSAEWRHEPGEKMATRYHRGFFGEEEIPSANKTVVKGALVADKEIVKVFGVDHPSLVKDLEDDLAYQQLIARQEELVAENDRLAAKGKIFSEEIANAQREGRPVNQELNLTEDEYARTEVVIREINALRQQINICKLDFSERHRSRGQAPEHVVNLPTDKDGTGMEFTLDTESMLEEMVRLTESTDKYSFCRLNCSTTAAQVIRAGVDNTLHVAMKEEGFSASKLTKDTIITPASLHKRSCNLQTTLTNLNSAPRYHSSSASAAAVSQRDEDRVAPTERKSGAKTTRFKEKLRESVGADEDVAKADSEMGLGTPK